ncbi:HEPN domain-containing protein [Desulfitobacterium sp.]|uniref:HEPN domain-containing protein n=1 Tax=Desulfitobacterium sp. TaxID=49981 RepID=UPI002BA71884|nr:HEPN domain-containing protein [Desulfitobacterium sp.]HVJ49959.1 HEPN domain-containing protein [Desulfitobacterium sp.]
MDPYEKFTYWENKAIYDIETSKAMLQTGRYTYVAFMAQQAVEKIVKGLYVLYTDREPVRTHNIWTIFKELMEEETFRDQNGNLFEKVGKYKPFFSDLLFYYIAERYPDYKQQLSSNLTEIRAKEVLNKAEEVFAWLQSLSRYKS